MTESGEQLGKYTLEEVIGEGAMARVWKAVRSGPMGFRKTVAIKQILPRAASKENVVKSLINEARMGGYLQHKNLVEIYEFDQEGDSFYIAMEYVGGYSLFDIMAKVPDRGLIPPPIVAEIAVQLCEGLAAAHAAVDEDGKPLNLVHRDLKPGNVMVTHNGVVKVMDFGIAKSAANLYQTSAMDVTRGTPIYMSPEQVRGEQLDNRSDLFGLGSLLVELITGEVAFYDPQLMNVLRRVNEAEISDAMAAVEMRMPPMAPILRRALQRDRKDRFPDAEEMGQEIRLSYESLSGNAGLAAWLRAWMRSKEANTGKFSADPTQAEQTPIEEPSTGGAWAARVTRALKVPGKEQPGSLVEHRNNLVMAWVDPGEFWMGSPDDEPGHQPDEPRHRVRISRPYLIGVTPITVEQFVAVMGAGALRSGSPGHPVVSVSWYEALQYCNRLSSLEGLQPAYQMSGGSIVWNREASGFRMPSEAEWEYAARGHMPLRYSGSDEVEAVAWYFKNAGGVTQPVARKQPNALGLYDMSGNVLEWVWDLYGPYPTDERTVDPDGAENGTMRVARGGSVQSVARDVRVAARFARVRPSDRHGHVGFRVARKTAD